jgi:hypothetical protein
MKDEQDVAAKRRREDPISQGDLLASPNPDAKVFSSRWMVQLVKGLIVWKQV